MSHKDYIISTVKKKGDTTTKTAKATITQTTDMSDADRDFNVLAEKVRIRNNMLDQGLDCPVLVVDVVTYDPVTGAALDSSGTPI